MGFWADTKARVAEEKRQREAELHASDERRRMVRETCTKVFPEAAMAYFAAGLHVICDESGRASLSAIWQLHFDSLRVPFVDLVDQDLGRLRLVRWQGMPQVPAPETWWLDVVRQEADLIGMSFEQFGSTMTKLFLEPYNRALREHRAFTARMPSNFHGYVSARDQMSADEIRAYDSAVAVLDSELKLARGFACDYASQFEPQLVAQLVG